MCLVSSQRVSRLSGRGQRDLVFDSVTKLVMIYYDTANFSNVLFTLRGSPLMGYGPMRALVAALLTLLFVLLHEQYGIFQSTDSTAFKDTLTVSNTFMGLLISFRLNSAFQQWRAGVVAIGAFGEAARNLMSTACAQLDVLSFDEESSSIQEDTALKLNFLTDLRRLVLLYVAIVFHHCRDMEDMQRLKATNLLTETEFQELEASGAESRMAVHRNKHKKSVASASPNKLRAAAVELWLRRLVQDAQRKNYLVVAQANVLNASITSLTQLYHTVFTIAHTPIPFNYAQYLEFCIVMYLFLYAAAIVPNSGWATAAWVFVWGLVLFIADDVANEIECPFGTDANDIDLEARMLKIEDELTILLKSQYHFGGISAEKREIRPRARTSPQEVKETVVVMEVKAQSMGTLDLPMLRPTLSCEALPEIDEYTPLIVNDAVSPESNYHSCNAPPAV